MSASPDRLSLLLPAYLNGTLSDTERRWVDEQLAARADARAELEELRSLKRGLSAHWESEPAPSPSARTRVMAAIGKQAREEAQPGFGARIGAVLSALFAPKWVPAAALGVIVLQFGLLVGMNNFRATTEPTEPEIITPRGGPDVVFPTMLKLVLKSDAKQSDVTALLQEMRAQIISGPDAAGAYILGLRTDNPDRINQRIALARSRGDVVASVEIATP
jgi:hypothetical protein